MEEKSRRREGWNINRVKTEEMDRRRRERKNLENKERQKGKETNGRKDDEKGELKARNRND